MKSNEILRGLVLPLCILPDLDLPVLGNNNETENNFTLKFKIK